MQGTLEGLILLAVVGLLILLRFDARRFGAAEYDDEEAPGGWRTWLRRLSWYVFGLLLLLVVYFLYPQPLSVLHLQMGEPRTQTLILGLGLGAMGIAFALVYAWLRFSELRLPPARRYPGGVINAVATAFIDEAVFRGILLGLLIASDWPVNYAIAFQAVLYALSTRLAGRGRPRGMLLLELAVGVIGGALTLQSGGIGAAFLGHALTRLAIFIAMGHAGQMRAVAIDEEEEALEQTTSHAPAGWGVVVDREQGGPSDYRW
ncbi:MAG TPA: CPBP family intramembrane glutamic endopeptidase [Candidatus Limnocylindrales bacterium]|nr:CPBP family intramembrane glutamic endopeptidase [Candidatus Limnocylindrales bacterium]